MIREKKYFIQFLFILILSLSFIPSVNAESFTPTRAFTQERDVFADGETRVVQSADNAYATPLGFGSGALYSSYAIPCNLRLVVVASVNGDYVYKFTYTMNIYTPFINEVNFMWNSLDIDKNYDLLVLDDNGVVKDSACSVISTNVKTDTDGMLVSKRISCTASMNKSATNNWFAVGYFCRGACTIQNMESLGFASPDSYMTVTNPTYERFTNDQSIIIDQNQTIIDQNNTTNEELGNLNDNITNDNVDNDKVTNAFNEFESFVDENATISSLLTLPVTLFTAILNGMQNSCTPFNLGSLYGEDLILPCIDISSYLGSTLWTMIDIIISGFAIYFISQKFIKVFNTFSSMKEGDVIDD